MGVRGLVTIGMPVFNCGQTLGPALRSVLNQTYQDWELILIDDGSRDDTLQVCRRFSDPRIRLVEGQCNLGLPARLNEAVAVAGGEFFARMDGDDVSYPRRLELQIAYMYLHQDTDLVGGGVLVFGKDGKVLGTRLPPTAHRDICRRPYAGFAIAHPTFFGRTQWFSSWQFNPTVGAICDQDLLLRSYAASRFANIDTILLGYREERVDFRKSISYRSAFGRSLIAQHRDRGTAETALGLALIGAKWAVDAIAVASGLQHRLLMHRAKPAKKEEEAQWSAVWQTVNGAA
jgi:glycosyltransferase involved in cell wall biosynthesis